VQIIALRHAAALISQVYAGAAQAAFTHEDPRVVGRINKAAFAVKANDFAASLNGGAVQVDTAGSLPNMQTSENFLNMGQSTIFGHVRTILYLPRRVSDADLPGMSKR
jgi:hypothetical protein